MKHNAVLKFLFCACCDSVTNDRDTSRQHPPRLEAKNSFDEEGLGFGEYALRSLVDTKASAFT